jgi:alpha-1,4-glucan:alpha-1,4-glucan 6-glycosyltransferase/4-alpha-glucanotransferase
VPAEGGHRDTGASGEGSGDLRALHELAESYGVLLEYDDVKGARRRAKPEALAAVLRALGAEIEDGGRGAGAALAARRAELESRVLEPVLLCWEGGGAVVDLRLPPHPKGSVLAMDILLEGGGSESWTVPLRELSPLESGRVRLELPSELPCGYHRIQVEIGGLRAEALLIMAPSRAYSPSETEEQKAWGLFIPTYALSSATSWGMGDFNELFRLMEWAGAAGARAVGTLPLLATYLEEPFEPSPYSPVSRLFWNEVYLDVGSVPELPRCAGARDRLASRELTREIAELRSRGLVDYQRVTAAKRQILTELARCFFSDPLPERLAAFRRYLAGHPRAEDYAAFRATVDKTRRTWTEWPAQLREGGLTAADYDENDRRYHLYCQFLAHEQLASLAGAGRARLYLDLPLGVNPGGYDTWRERDAFALGVSGGAPPDPFFTRGQDWGFPPMHPEGIRRGGYAYLSAVLRGQMEHASYLRIDHVMGLHRLFWVPQGFEALDGVYVRYPHDELYAVLTLESHRGRCMVVGEDLGTVPPEVRPAMAEHGVGRLFVVQYEVPSDGSARLPQVPAGSVASLNTHDMPPFSAFLEGSDIEERGEFGHLHPESLPEERRVRREVVRTLAEALGSDAAGRALLRDPRDRQAQRELLGAGLDFLAESEAGLVLVSLEDLWLETEPQNLPGTGIERANWRRKAAFALEELQEATDLNEKLRKIEALRRPPDDPPAPERPETQPRDPADRRAPQRAGDHAPVERVSPDSRPNEDLRSERPTASSAVREWSLLTDEDVYLFNEGSHLRLYEHLGARLMEADGRQGAHFGVWAPNAESVSVVGDFNGWNSRSHPLRARAGSGIWEGFIAGVQKGHTYKYHVVSRGGGYRVNKADPFGRHHETPPHTGSKVWDLDFRWNDEEWMARRGEVNGRRAPMAVYEVHLGSWMRVPEDGHRSLSYREIAPRLADYVRDLGFTHVEFLPLMEHPFYGSWGYQTTGYFAPTSRYGTPQDFMYLIDHLHQKGIGVILDWVPSHFPSDEHGLAYFDGTHLFEHADPRQGFHPDWQSYIFNYGRHEVRSFLLSSAMFWLDKYHADGLRVDAVASMLYLDYSRKAGEWIPNQYGGRENLEAIDFLRRLNTEVYRHHPDVQTIAEESTSWPMVSRPTYVGGLGFGLKWDMGWMHDTLVYIAHEPIHRRYHHDQLTFRMIYAFTESFLLPLSHDEVVHGKGSLLAKMPGDDWQKFANLRLLLTYQYAQAGKKLLFMGSELGQWREWDHDGSLDWHLLQYDPHGGIQRLVRELNRLYRDEPAMHELDLEPEGFEWVAANDSEQSAIAFLRRGRSPDEVLLFALNFTPVPRTAYLVGAPYPGFWREVMNSDAQEYGGSGHGNMGGVEATPISCHGRPYCLALTLPPLGAVALKGPGPEGR